MKIYTGIFLWALFLASCADPKHSNNGAKETSSCRPELTGSDSKQGIAVAFSRLNGCHLEESDLSNLLSELEK